MITVLQVVLSSIGRALSDYVTFIDENLLFEICQVSYFEHSYSLKVRWDENPVESLKLVFYSLIR